MIRILALLAILFASPALAQNPAVHQSGNVTPGHVAMWATNGAIQDGGTAAIGFLTAIGVTAQGPGICQNSAPVTAGAYNQVCLTVSPTGGGLAFSNFNGATGSLTFTINGIAQAFPSISLPTTTNGFTCFTNTTGGLKDCPSSPVTSVGLSLDSSIFNVTGSPVTSSGTLTGSLATQTANFLWAGPTTGSPAAPTFRAMVSADCVVATVLAVGCVQPDGTTIVIVGGVITAVGGGGGGGSVSSVGLALPASVFTISGSPVTVSGTLTGALATQTANFIWAGPTTGSAAAPTFRAMVAADCVAATSGAKGCVQPDNSTIAVSGGIINCVTATSSVVGCVKPDNSSITISGGVISAPAAGAIRILAGTGTLVSGNCSPVSGAGCTVSTEWAVNGSKIYNNNGGNVGIGTSNPGFPLDIQTSASNVGVQIGNSQGDMTLSGGDGANAYINSEVWGLGLQTGGITRLNIRTSGNIGIGTTAPQSLLDVAGTFQAKVAYGMADLREWATLSCNPAAPVSTNVASAITAAQAAGYTKFFMPAGCFLNMAVPPSGWSAFTIPANISILGENNLTSGLSVCASFTSCSNPGQDIVMGPNVQLDNIFYQSNFCWNIFNPSIGGASQFPYCPIVHNYNGGSSSAAITGYPYQNDIISCGKDVATGGVTANPDVACLAVENFSGSAGDTIYAQIGGSHSTISGHTVFASNGNIINAFFNDGNNQSPAAAGVVFQVKGDGRVYVGGPNSPHTNGSIIVQDYLSGPCEYFAGNSTWTCPSDARLKTNIRPTGDVLADLMTIPISNYKWIKTGEPGMSVVAQDMLKIHPEMVHKGTDGYYSVDAIEPIKLLRAIQELTDEVCHSTSHHSSRFASICATARVRADRY